MRLSSFILLTLGWLSSPLVTASQASGAECALIESSTKRLLCYDEIFMKEPEQSNSSSIGGWQVTEKTNPLDDSKTVVLALMSTEGRNYLGKYPVLIARCMSDKTEVYIGWNEFLGSDSSRVTLRVGDEPARVERWSHSTDDRATFAQSDIRLLKQMLNADRLVAQVTPYRESPITAIFPLTGLSDAIKPLRETCGW